MKLVFHSSTIAMMHGPINIRLVPYALGDLTMHNIAYTARLLDC